MATKTIECALNSPHTTNHTSANNFYTVHFDEEIVLNRGDLVNCSLGIINTTLTGEEYIEINDSNNTGTIGCQFLVGDGFTLQESEPGGFFGKSYFHALPPEDGNFSNWTDFNEFNQDKPILISDIGVPAVSVFLQQDLVITIPNGFYTPSEIANIINRRINEPMVFTRRNPPSDSAVVNPFCVMIYSDNGAFGIGNTKATKWTPSFLPAPKSNDHQNVRAYFPNGLQDTDVLHTIGSPEGYIIGATAPLFQFDTERNRFNFSNLHSPAINYTSANAPSWRAEFNSFLGPDEWSYTMSGSGALLKLSTDGGLWNALGFTNTLPLTQVLDRTFGGYATFWNMPKLSTISIPFPSAEWSSALNNPQFATNILPFSQMPVDTFLQWNSSLVLAERSPLLLNTLGYYLVRSDICDEVSFYSTRAKQAINIVAFLNKNYQSSVFYYCFSQNQPIEVRKQKILKNITIELLQPDLTVPPALLKNTTIIFQVTSRPQPTQPLYSPIYNALSILGADLDLAEIAELRNGLTVKKRHKETKNDTKKDDKEATDDKGAKEEEAAVNPSVVG